MLPRERRLRTKDINRLFNRTDTQKIVAYPFVYFLGKKRVLKLRGFGQTTGQDPMGMSGLNGGDKTIQGGKLYLDQNISNTSILSQSGNVIGGNSHNISLQKTTDSKSSLASYSQKIQPKAGNTMDTYAQWGIQISNKFSKSAVKRHILKRSFYDLVERLVPAHIGVYYILAVPQKNRLAECTQLLATADKTTIVNTIQKQYTDSLSLFVKRLGSSAESKTQGQPSNNAKNVWKKKKPNN